ncbi:predicted protein, partial [Nematostella vectensis]
VFTGSLWICVFAEYLGTLLFMFSVSAASLRWEGTPSTLEIALAAGFSMATVTQVFRWVSRPLVHANPAVTVASFLAGDTSLVASFLYVIVQCFGAITGAGLLHLVCPAYARGTLGATSLAVGTTPPQALGTEIIVTFLLVSAILSTLDACPRDDNYDRYDVSAAVGLAVTLGYLVALPLTGAGLNPARSFGPAILTNNWQDHWVYWCGPLVGAVIAGLMYNMLLHRGLKTKRVKHAQSDTEELSP